MPPAPLRKTAATTSTPPAAPKSAPWSAASLRGSRLTAAPAWGGSPRPALTSRWGRRPSTPCREDDRGSAQKGAFRLPRRPSRRHRGARRRGDREKDLQSPPGHCGWYLHFGLHRHCPPHEPPGAGGHHPGGAESPPRRGRAGSPAHPGNYGEAYIRDVLGLPLSQAVQCSNYIGAALDDAVRLGFSSVLLVGHLGKLTKLAAGITDTHSRTADGRRRCS